MPAGRLWTKDFVLALCIAIFFSFTFYLLITSMVGYAVTRFSASDAVAGLAASGFVIGAIGARLIAGPLLDLGNRYRTILIAIGLAILASCAYLVADSVWFLIAVRFVHGLTFGVGHTGLMASVQDIIPGPRRGEGTGYFATSTTLAAALGPFLAITLVDRIGYDALFFAAIAVTVIPFIGLFFLKIPQKGEPQKLRLKNFGLRRVLDRHGIRIGFIALLGGMGYASVMTFLAEYTKSLSMFDVAPLFFLSFAIVSLITRLTLGRVQDRYGDNVVVYPLYLCFLGSLGLILLGDATWMFVVAGGLAGAGWGSLMSCLQAITINCAGLARSGTATASFFLMMDAGFGFGPVVYGGVRSLFGYDGLWLAAIVMVVLSIVAYSVLHFGRGRRPFHRREDVAGGEAGEEKEPAEGSTPDRPTRRVIEDDEEPARTRA
ncbi:MFS transporter [Brevibacterium litoralis]|uniref:MFS transporter n=1 Tax=Brevibacterium litoralis TaxID=3138935 RepID=UPI0032EBE5E6